LCAAALAALLTLVWTGWPPLATFDARVVVAVNTAVAAHARAQVGLRFVTTLGNAAVLSAVVAITAAALLIGHRPKLAALLVFATVPAFTVGPSIKAIVARPRPAVDHPLIALPASDSFPSGHALGSMVCYGAIAVFVVPAVARRWETPIAAMLAVLIAAIGLSRVGLGVHYPSDVLGGFLLGAAWLALVRALCESPVGARLTDRSGHPHGRSAD
jgi:undecaprenyl-diphosphatase